MKILALYDVEDIAILLTDLTMITEVEVVSVPGLDRFSKFLEKGKFNAVYILDKFFADAIPLVLRSNNFPKGIVIFVQDEEDIPKYLRLGITDLNIETIPFNPLTLFMKTRSLLEVLEKIEYGLKHEQKTFDFYKHGLFNVLNTLLRLQLDVFLSVKDLEEDKILYSIRVRRGSVVSVNRELEEVVKINTDDSIPKAIEIGPVQHEDKVVFRDTADFYVQLLEAEVEEKEEEVVNVEKVVEKPKKVLVLKENPIRGRYIYSFHYGDFTVYSQPVENARLLEGNVLLAVPFLNDAVVQSIKNILMGKPTVKFLASPIVKGRLISLGIPPYVFYEPEDPSEVQLVDLPHLAGKYESFIWFSPGIAVTGSLMGSFVSKEVDFMERVFLSHLKVFHHANITSTERLKFALDKLSKLLEKTFYILPYYGYGIDYQLKEAVLTILGDMEIPLEYSPLSEEWRYLADSYSIEAESYSDFLRKLSAIDDSLLFSVIDDMEVLGIVPLEL